MGAEHASATIQPRSHSLTVLDGTQHSAIECGGSLQLTCRRSTPAGSSVGTRDLRSCTAKAPNNQRSWNGLAISGGHIDKATNREHGMTQRGLGLAGHAHGRLTLTGHLGKACLKSGREVTPGHDSSVGVPNSLQGPDSRHAGGVWIEISIRGRCSNFEIKVR